MNAALISQGCDELLSHNDGTNEGRLLSLNWASIVESEFERAALNFTKQQAQLLSRQDGKFGYDDSYVVPAAALHVRRLWVEDDEGVRSFPDWVQDGSSVHVDAEEGVFIEYVNSAETALWGANFARGVQMKLEAVLLRFKEEHSTAGSMEQQAEMYFQEARTISSKSRSAQAPFKPGRLATARFRRG